VLIINWYEPDDLFGHSGWATDNSITSLDDGETPRFDNPAKLRETLCSGGVFVHFHDTAGEVWIELPDLYDHFENYLLQ